MNPLIIFGSAAAATTSDPGDIDVACAVPLQPEDFARIAAWSETRGLRSTLAVDAHQLIRCVVPRTASGGWDTTATPSTPGAVATARLPAPAGCRGAFVVLPGSEDVTIQWDDYWSIPAILRAYPTDAKRVRETWRKFRDHARGAGINTLHGPMFDVGPAEGSSLWPTKSDWTNYVSGRVAWASAIRKSKVWKEIAADPAFPEAALVDDLLREGAPLSLVVWARTFSSGAGARLLLRKEGVTTQYGDKVVPYEAVYTSFEVNRLTRL